MPAKLTECWIFVAKDPNGNDAVPRMKVMDGTTPEWLPLVAFNKIDLERMTERATTDPVLKGIGEIRIIHCTADALVGKIDRS